MRKVLFYPGGTLEFPIEDDRVLAVWKGPSLSLPGDLASRVRRALDAPLDLPALNLCVVPGDKVVIAADPAVPGLEAIVAVVANLLESAGVEREAITLMTTDASLAPGSLELPPGIAVVAHDADDAPGMAYLANTEAGRRVQLNRLATDADFVLSIGTITRDRAMSWSGPWSVIFPGLSDRETRRSYAAGRESAAPDLLRESAEVGWLLGSQFQIGVVAVTGEVFAGLGESVREAALRAVQEVWTLRVDRRADLVVVGTSPSAGLEATWTALATGAKLVRRGGRVVALSDAAGPIGPATRHLLDHEERGASAALRGSESEPDHDAARQLAEALDWADLYLLSKLDDGEVEDLGLVPLGKASEAQRLASSAGEVILVSQAEMTVPIVVEDSE